MLERKHHENPGTNLPSTWLESITETLNQTYQSDLELRSKKFEVYGQSFPDELLLIVGLHDKNHDSILPVSYFASLDLLATHDSQKILNTLVDSVGIFFDHYFSQEDWSDFEPNWQEHKINNIHFFYKFTRENVSLTLRANELLS